jgi:lysophospholipase L1-like esterase
MRWANLGLCVGSALIALIGVELGLRVWSPSADPYGSLRRIDREAYIPKQHPPRIQLQVSPEPGLNGVEGVRHFSINRWGFRGDDLEIEKPPGERRVFLIGGSTMECATADDANAPNRLLAQRLAATFPGTKVENAGHSGDASYDHLAIYTGRVAHFSPDVVVVMAGLNDLRAAIEHRDYLHLEAHDPIELTPWMLLRLGASTLEIGKRLFHLLPGDRVRVAPGSFDGQTHTSNYRKAAATCQKLPLSAAPPPTLERYYRDNLISLIGAVKARGAQVVLVTQATSWASVDPKVTEWHWLACVAEHRYEGRTLAVALERYNEVTRAVAREQGVALVDLAAQLPATLDHFYDDAHFNDVGVEALVAALADPVGAALAL